MVLRKRSGQSTIEYLIMIAVVIAMFVVVALNYFKPNIQKIFERGTKKAATMLGSANMFPAP